MVNYIWVPIGVGLLAVLFAVYLIFDVLRKDTGTPGMQKIAKVLDQVRRDCSYRSESL